ncbi:hypothetical protein J5N97_012151 [Dioscorea zingiberensis]|uniref:Two-component response regulator-like PRR95 n=1 Tax=Dioscorea zingiberensis TaxID=325984 RepID=A0A9D5CQH9_9LILI|nr:hypothetical protein J5N97_012151 [Dioscorea zingiberensis]
MAAAKHPPIRWERVLPRRSLRVLLVENDDSTRHIVIALLRKCGYHVAAVADGVKAWEVLIEKEYNFDLVLAEVDMPTLSGIGLLSRIMGDEGCKNIPVIMMSPYDSVSVVLKCMLKEELKGDLEEIFKLHSKGKEVVAPLPGGLRVYGQKLVLNEEKLEWQVMLFLNAQPPHARNFTIWPSPIFRSTLDKYSTEFQSVSRWLFDVIAKSLRLNPEVLCGIFNDHQRMWMKYHPPCIQANQVIDINPLSLMAEKENMLRVISAYGFEQSSAIQQWGIVSSIKGLDIIHQAQAGIGRTANWCSDILQQLNCGLLECQVWDLTPIQELAHPIEKIMQTLGDQLGVKDYACVGGSSNRKDPRILSTRFYAVVGTPGRLLAMLRPDHIDMFVLDEAEEMLSCGYKDQICDIYQLRPLPSKFQSSSYANGTDNNAASNHISANAGEGSETGENSDEGNNAHHSGSKPEVDIGGDQEPMEPLHVGGNSTYELETKEDHVDQILPMNFNCETGDKSRGIVAEVTLPAQDSSLVEKVQTAECSYRTFPFSDGVLGHMRFKGGVSINPDSYCHNNSINEPSSSMNGFTKNDTREIFHGAAKSSHKDGSYGSLSSFMQLNGCTRQEPKEGSKLKHSDNSAFSRYGYEKLYPLNPCATSSTLCIRTTNCVDQHASHPSTDGFDNERNTSISPRKRLSSPQMKVGETPLYFQIPPNSNNEDAGFSASDQPREDACVGHSSTREDATFHPQLGYIAVPIPMGAVPYQTLCAGHHSILQPLFHCENSLSAHGSTAIGEHIGVPCVPVDQSNQTGSGSHDILHVSWSNCSGEASNAVVNRGNALESGNENDVQNCNRKGLGHDHSRRAAALIKFRLKRKARCFEKKVRYYSRQKLAEQRPRVKGQFVRQKSVGSSKATDTEE